MTTIIRLNDNEMNKLPKTGRAFIVKDEKEELISMEKFVIRYGELPENIYRWKQYLYFPVTDKIEKMIREAYGPESNGSGVVL